MNTAGFDMVPKEAKHELSRGAYLLFTYIIENDYADDKGVRKGYIFQYQKTIAKTLNVCVRTIQRWAKELKEKKFVEIKRRGFNMCNNYKLLKRVATMAKQVKEKVKVQKDNYKNKFKKKEIPFVDHCVSRNYTDEQYDIIEKRLLGLT